MINKRDIILRELFNIFEINDNDDIYFSGDFNKLNNYHHFLTLLRSEALEVDKIKRKLEYIRYYFEFPNEPDFVESKKILVALKKQQTPSFELFIELLYDKIANYKNEFQVKKYVLYYPINISELKNEISEFKINDSVISLQNYLDVKSNLDKINFDENNIKIKKFDITKYRYAKVSVHCRNAEYAQQKATVCVGLLLYFLSYSKTFRKRQIWLWGFPEPLIELKLNYIFVFEEDNFYTGYHFPDTSDVNKFYDLENSDIKNINSMISQFNNANEKIKEIIHSSMNQYHIGLKEKSISKSFLSFWTSLEILTLKDKKLSHFMVKERLKSIINVNNIHEIQIERLYNLRNKLVHTGNSSEISPFDRNLIKMYVEALFEYFMFNFSKYSYKEIDIIYDFFQKDISSLEKSKMLIDEVVKLKSPKH